MEKHAKKWNQNASFFFQRKVVYLKKEEDFSQLFLMIVVQKDLRNDNMIECGLMMNAKVRHTLYVFSHEHGQAWSYLILARHSP